MSALNPLGIPFIELPTIDSTNNYAMGMVHAGMAHHGTAVFTHEQTKGKGQRNRLWLSQKDQNIALSLVIQPQNLLLSELFILSRAVANGVCDFFNMYTTDSVKIKWPNDIYWCDRKAGGILIENVLKGQEWKFAIAGVGLNINQTYFPGLETKAVSLRQITGKNYEPLVLAKELCTFIDNQFNTLLNDREKIRNDYAAHLYKLNEKVKMKKGNRLFEAVVCGVSEDGRLIVQHATEEYFAVGEVEWII